MTKPATAKGFSAIEAIVIVLVVAALGTAGWLVWDKTHAPKKPDTSSQTGNKSRHESDEPADETNSWISVTSQENGFTMKVPDGWVLTNYPADFIGSTQVVYKAGQRATIETSNIAYAGHLLKFRASIVEIDDSGLGPQWSSPQEGLNESTQDFSIGSLSGKRYKGVFTGLDQTLYEYVFSLGNNKKLDIVYTIYQGDTDDVQTVEKAIKTIQLK
jgi:hypothetical protein